MEITPRRTRSTRGRRARSWLRSLIGVILWRLDRGAPTWVRALTPYGTSLTFHGLALLILAVLVWSEHRRAAPKTFEARLESIESLDDLTTLAPATRPGDPFTNLDAPEPPSLTLDPNRSDPDVSNLPELPPNITFAPNLVLSGARSALASASTGPALGPLTTPGWTAPFAGRRPDLRARLVRREGGSVQSEQAVEKGLDWLARHQAKDGHWSLDPRAECQGRGCPEVPAMVSDSAATGLALLPLLGAGYTHTQKDGRHRRTVERGLQWLIAHQRENGSLFTPDLASNGGEGNTALYSHAIATMAICEAYGLTADETLKLPAQRAIDFIGAAQSPQNGGWRYEPGMAGDTSVTGWQVLALRSAQLSGLEVSDRVVKGAIAYMNFAATDPKGATYAYMPGGRASPTMTAEGLLVRQYFGWKRSHIAIAQGASIVLQDLLQSKDRNVYYWYYATPMLHNIQGRAWSTWNPLVREALIRSQMKGGACESGSWDPLVPSNDRWGRRAGRLYQTSLSLLTLEVYYRYLPLYRSIEKDALTPEGPPETEITAPPRNAQK